MLAQFARTEILLNSGNIEKLATKHVLIAGLGGVGGYVAEAMLRAGVGRLSVIDHDLIDLSNLNRQLLTTLANVGQAKVNEFALRARLINPQLDLATHQIFIGQDNLAELLTPAPDYVIDCIDTMEAKLALISYCLKHKIKIVASMGAGNRIDVTKVKLADISKTSVCALARNIRLRLRKAGIKKGLMVAYSEEVPFAKPLINTDGSRPTNGTISYLPALFGILLAGKVLQDLIVND